MNDFAVCVANMSDSLADFHGSGSKALLERYLQICMAHKP